jgi:ureidoacrylate peracid hydrolase
MRCIEKDRPLKYYGSISARRAHRKRSCPWKAQGRLPLRSPLEICGGTTGFAACGRFSRGGRYLMQSKKGSTPSEGNEPKGFVKPVKSVRMRARPESIELDLHRTAVIVVDMQNGFVSKGGMFDTFGWDISGARGVIDNNRRIIDAARRAGCKIVFLKMSYDRDYSNSGGSESPNWYKEIGLVLMRNHPKYWGKFVTKGSWDEEICEQLKIHPGDILIRKQRYSGFAGTNLDVVLKTYRVKYCIYTGVATNVCVESTLRDGYFLDYWPIMISDAVHHVGPSITQEATLWNVEALFGWVSTTEEFLNAVSEKKKERTQPGERLQNP